MPYRPNDSSLSDEAHQAYSAFVEQKHLNHSAYNRRPEEQRSLWVRYGAMALRLGVHPASLMRAMFTARPDPARGTLTVRELKGYSLEQVTQLAKVTGVSGGEDKNVLRVDRSTLEAYFGSLQAMAARLTANRPKRYQHPDMVWLDPYLSIPAWARMLSFSQTSQHTRVFKEEAKAEYEGDPAVRDFIQNRQGHYAFDLTRLQ